MKKFLNFDFRGVANKITLFWNKYYKLFLVIFFLVVSLWGSYLWYWYLYKFEWGSERINQYINSHDQEVKFKEENFKMIINEIERRKNAYNENNKPVKDIFGPLVSPDK